MTVYTRRLSDKILLAFDQACETGSLDCAELLLKALEMSLTSMGGPGCGRPQGEHGAVCSRLRTSPSPEKRPLTA
jgi:hypothetical protein